MLWGDRSLSELGPHALSSAGTEGLRPRLPTDGLHVTQGAAHVPHRGAGISQACGQLVCHCGAPPRQTTHKRITRCDALYGVGERRRGQSRPPHPHPRRAWLRVALPASPLLKRPGLALGSCPRLGLQSRFPMKPGEQETAPSARGLREEQMTRLAARSLWRSTADDQEVIRQ